ncbi:MAG TPA: NAD-dependent DNA ligase LigA, partial [Cyclobacteriaceae bacterium]|nr:NAD-dependent DNA ligase LigA [Cyclobacteriaceae bacterium]
MTTTEAKKEIARLSEVIEHHNNLYYQQHKTEISDYDFDQLLKQLAELEEQFPDLRQPDSPTQRVGGSITKNFETVVHQYPMLSLGNTYSIEELEEFDKRVSKGLGNEPYEYFCELKFDGVSISLIYENGILVKGVTRGDGVRGDDVTANVKTIRSIPLKIKGANVPKQFEVRGEVFLSRSVFNQLNKDREDIGEEVYANARNTASGTLKMQNSGEVARRKLDCYVYYLLGENLGAETHAAAIAQLESWGFNVSDTYAKAKTIDKVFDYINSWEKKRLDLPLETDGVVIKINSLLQQRK